MVTTDVDPELVYEVFHRAMHCSGYHEAVAWREIRTNTPEQWAWMQALYAYSYQIEAAIALTERSLAW